MPCPTTEHSSGAWSVSLELTFQNEYSRLESRQLRKGLRHKNKEQKEGKDK